MAHEVLVLKAGQVVESGLAEQVLNQPEHSYTRSLLAAFPNG
jgi:ABC-type dipeptide/oligopeptide/nickel transport system ATPase component